MHPSREPLLIRPKISSENLHNFIDQCFNLVGKKYNQSAWFSFLYKKKSPKTEDSLTLASHEIFKAFCRANPEFYIPAFRFEFLSISRTGRLSADDFHHLALLMPENFEAPTSLNLFKNSILTENASSEKISEVDLSLDSLKKSGLQKVLEYIISLTERNDLISVFLFTARQLFPLSDSTKDLVKYIPIVSALVNVVKVLGDLKKYGLTSKLYWKLASTWMAFMVSLFPQTLTLKVTTNILNKVVNTGIGPKISQGAHNFVTTGLKFTKKKVPLLKAKI